MGVKKLSTMLEKKYNESFKTFGYSRRCKEFQTMDTKESLCVDALHFDLNSIIHDVYESGLKVNIIDEEEIIKNLLYVVVFLLKVMRPKFSVTIATDGVVPYNKVLQKRIRCLQRCENEAKKNKNNRFVRFKIKPGTGFMELLKKKLVECMEEYISEENPDLKIYYSSDLVPGEGEHKIMNFIRGMDANYSHAVFSPDSDMYFLGLKMKNHNINLLKIERIFKSSLAQNLLYNFEYSNIYENEPISKILCTNLKGLREGIHKEFKDKIKANNPTILIGINEAEEKKLLDNLVEDLIFLCFLAGNDFLYAVPRMSFKPENGTWNILINQLAISFDKIFIVTETGLNLKKLTEILDELANEIKDPKMDENMEVSQCEPNDEKSKDTEKITGELENLQCGGHAISNEDSKETHNETNTESDIENEEKGKEYIKALCWLHSYYSGKKVDLKWYYPCNGGPKIKELAKACGKLGKDNYQHEEKEQEHITPLEQLMYVICPYSKEILPKELQPVLDLIEGFDQEQDKKDITAPFRNQKQMKEFYEENFPKISQSFQDRNRAEKDVILSLNEGEINMKEVEEKENQ